ncbi:MAG TPA: carbon-phosphorus lyase complex subunit PhnI [Candidatus Dormibacteraeota bacterium]|nr:carbon-phosphorus lyase complex subunit PhnI [Candidatus Dormibacteraeota bacterium]
MYTTVLDQTGAIAAAARLARDGTAPGAAVDDLCALLPLLVDQVAAEAGVAEPRICARALREARGDIARAVSLVRAWAATLPRLAGCTVAAGRMRPLRRITPAFADPPGGQYLGATLDYAQRLLDLEEVTAPAAGTESGPPPAHAAAPPPQRFPRALEGLEGRGLVAAAEGWDRGGLLGRLARGETGAMTALAYSGIRGYGQRSDPTLVELRQGTLPVTVTHPLSGESVRVGDLVATSAEVVLYRVHDGIADPRLTVGVGATCGRVERRAISAALLDANCARASLDPAPPPCDDREFVEIVLDGQEAAGFVEHLKLPHHVTFTSDLERLTAVGDRVDDALVAAP